MSRLSNFLRYFQREERRPVSKRDFEDAVGQIMTAPRGKSKRENREPTKAEREERFRLVRQ